MSDKPILPAGPARSFFRNPVGRVAVLWGVLIAMFLVIWFVLEPDPNGAGGHGASSTPLSPSAASFSATYAIGLAVGGVLLAVLFTGRRRFNAANSVGLRALAEGDFALAEGEFAVLAKRFRWFRSAAGVARFNVAVTCLYRGKLQEAIERFGKTEKDWSTTSLRPNAACYLAIAYGLRGELDVARKWLATAEKRLETSPFRSVLAGFIDFGRATIELREGRSEEVHRWLEARWRGLEGSLTGATLRPLTVLRAFASAQASGQREIGTAQRILHALDPIRPGEFAMLEAAWPEMKSFIDVTWQ